MNNINITVTGGIISEEEKREYVRHIQSKFPHKEIEWIKIELDGEYVNLSYQLAAIPFERVRRITGYLVGTLDRFNDAKRAEEADRVKHSI